MSRYQQTPTRKAVLASGEEVAYYDVQPVAPASDMRIVGEVSVEAAEIDRPDLVAQRALNNPLLSTRLACASNALSVLDLCDRPGRVLPVPGPDF